MIGITELGTYIPSARESNHEKKALFGVDDGFLEGKVGVHAVARKAPDEATSDMCVAAFQALLQKTHVDPTEVDCLAVCTQNPDGDGLPHTSAIVHGKLGCRDGCAAFDVGLGCSGYVYSLSIVQAFMQQNGMSRGLLFTADPYSGIVNPADKNTALLFGDAATVTLLSDAPVFTPIRFTFGTRGTDCDVLRSDHGVLSMNGRAMFNFAVTEVPPQIVGLVESEGMSLQDVDRVLLHQGSKYVVDVIRRRLRLQDDRAPLGFQSYGNTVSSSLPLLLEPCLAETSIRTVILSGFGVGLSWASALLQRAGQDSSAARSTSRLSDA